MNSELFSPEDIDTTKYSNNKRHIVQRFFRRATFWAVLLLSAISGSLTGLAIVYQFGITDEAKQVAALANYQPSVVTQVFADDGKTVMGEFALERRIPLSYDEIPPKMRQAIIAIEDARFEKHWGVDPLGIMRAFVKNSMTGKHLEGGSTLTQQLTKMLFLTPEKTYTRKIKEALLALQIERQYSKQQILELYCNQINLGGGAYGVEAGAQYYFGKSVKDLGVEECATLAAIPKAPTYFSPVLNYKNSLERRNLVLVNMVEEGFITAAEGEIAKQKKINLNLATRDGNNSGPYAFFVEEVRRELEETYGTRVAHTGGLQVITTLDAQAQIKAVNAIRAGLHGYDRRHSKWRGDLHNVFEDGVKDLSRYKHPDWDLHYFEGMYLHGLITEVNNSSAKVRFGHYYATVSAKELSIAGGSPSQIFKVGDLCFFRITHIKDTENTATEEIKDKRKNKKSETLLQTDTDPNLLQVELEQQPQVSGSMICLDAHNGEVKVMVGGYDFSLSKFNNATQGNRQTGSTFKPFIYTAALESGWRADDVIADVPFTQGSWSPHNYDGGFMGPIPLRTALAQSRNVPAVRLLSSIGIKKGVDMVKRFGITNPMAPYLPSALGATEVPLIEMVSAYSVFPNHGERAKPHYIKRIQDRNGRTLFDYAKDESEHTFKVVSPYISSQMVSLMRGVVEGGTAAAIKSVKEGDLNKREIAGKTGTVNDFTDAWFIGYTPSIACGVWIGYPGEKRSLGSGETGGHAALPMWIKFMSYYLKDKPIEKFSEAPTPDQDIKALQSAHSKEVQKELEIATENEKEEEEEDIEEKPSKQSPDSPSKHKGIDIEDGDIKKKINKHSSEEPIGKIKSNEKNNLKTNNTEPTAAQSSKTRPRRLGNTSASDPKIKKKDPYNVN